MSTRQIPQDPLVARNLTLHRGSLRVLHGLGLTLRAGDVLGLIGLNGAGKSTTLQCLAGHLAPDSGDILINGHDVIADPVGARQHIGYLPDPPALHTELRVETHLKAMAGLYGIARSERALSVERVIDLCSLADVTAKRIAHLSQGYRQRVGLAQALLHRPSVVLLDEPTNGLDIGQQDKFAQTVRDIAVSAAVVVSSHHLSDLRGCCNRFAALDAGTLTELTTGTPDDTVESVFIRLQHPASKAELCGLPLVLNAEADRDGWKVSLQGGTAHLSQCIADHGWGLMQMSPLLFEPERPLPISEHPSPVSDSPTEVLP